MFPSNQVGYVSKLSFFLNHVSNFTEINSTLFLGPTFGLWIPDYNPFLWMVTQMIHFWVILRLRFFWVKQIVSITSMGMELEEPFSISSALVLAFGICMNFIFMHPFIHFKNYKFVIFTSSFDLSPWNAQGRRWTVKGAKLTASKWTHDLQNDRYLNQNDRFIFNRN